MPQGRVTTYDLTVGVVIEMDDHIHQLDPFDVPLLGTYGADGRTTLAKDSCFEKKVEWLDDTLLTPRDTLGEALDSSETVVTIDTANKFGVGHVILIDSEYMLVTGVSADGLDLTVTRGYGDSSAASHDDNKTIIGVGTALAEGSDPEAFRSVDRSARYNITQIFGPHKVSLSGTEQVVRKYGTGTNEWGYQVSKVGKQLAVDMEQALLYGQREDDSAGDRRTMGGLIYYISTNVNSSDTTITEALLLDQMQAVFNAGGSVDRLVCGSKTKRVISAFKSGLTVNINETDRKRGQIVDSFTSDFGQASIHLNRWCRTADLFGFSRDQATVKTLRPTQFQMLAKTGDADQGQVLNESTLQFVRERHAFRFSALT